ARIKSILRKAEESNCYRKVASAAELSDFGKENGKAFLLQKEIEILKIVNSYPVAVKEAGDAYSPAVIANYAYGLAKEFNQYYHDVPVLKEKNASLRSNRLALVNVIAETLTSSMSILGISLPERM
ncbi:MAG: arginine--tRNA ligase, partial [Bacteroidales bacterium]|nr:arginine--tRNA ligase [Bacteroidales bacterium]